MHLHPLLGMLTNPYNFGRKERKTKKPVEVIAVIKAE